MSGLMSVTGEGGGRPPVKVGSPCTDIMCGTLGALGISGTQSNLTTLSNRQQHTMPEPKRSVTNGRKAVRVQYIGPSASICVCSNGRFVLPRGRGVASA
jgi:hypothetical protein